MGFYDEEMHEHFVSYFKDHRCKGTIPSTMDKMQFCDFMNQTERIILPDSCGKNVGQSNNNNNNNDDNKKEKITINIHDDKKEKVTIHRNDDKKEKKPEEI